MKETQKFMLTALIPLLVLSACSDSSDSDREDPVTNPTPVDSMPGVETPPIDSPVTVSPQEPAATPSTPTDPDMEAPSTDPDMEAPSTGPADDEAAPINGNPIADSQWRICSGPGPSMLFQHSFTATDYSYIVANYDAGDCQGAPTSETEFNGGTYTLGNIITTTDGLEAIELNMYNTRLLGGELGSLSYAQYNIVHVRGDVLYLGYLPEQEEANRPQALHFDDEYRRYP